MFDRVPPDPRLETSQALVDQSGKGTTIAEPYGLERIASMGSRSDMEALSRGGEDGCEVTVARLARPGTRPREGHLGGCMLLHTD